MTTAEQPAAQPGAIASWVDNASRALQTAAPALLFGLRLWASVCLALYVAFWLELDTPSWAGRTAAIVCQPHLGASLRKGWYRLIGTVVGAIAIVVMTGCFPQDRATFLLVVALWGAGCALLANLLRNFASYSAALAGYTVAIIASDQLGAVGGLNGQAFMLAVNRASEICIGIVCAGIVLAGTDFGGARRQVAGLFAQLSAEIACRFTGTLADAGAEFEQTQTIRPSTRRSANPRSSATTPRSCRTLWTVWSGRSPAGARRRLSWRDHGGKEPGRRRERYWQRCRRRFARGLGRIMRRAGSRIRRDCSKSAMQRCGGLPPCRRRRHRPQQNLPDRRSPDL